jgi:hypothetical protein
MGIKELNEKCRSSSYTLINKIADKLKGKEDFEKYINVLIAGLGNNITYCSASVLALSSIVYHYNGKTFTRKFIIKLYIVIINEISWFLDSMKIQSVQNILDLSCSLVVQPTREIVQSALTLIKVYLTVMSTSVAAPTTSKIVSKFIMYCKLIIILN